MTPSFNISSILTTTLSDWTDCSPASWNRLRIYRKYFPGKGRTRISSDGSLSIMDILVSLEDESLLAVEIQRIGYDFPIKRGFCYGADLLVRQYDLARKRLGKVFSYQNIRPVYIIILMEKIPAYFTGTRTSTYTVPIFPLIPT